MKLAVFDFDSTLMDGETIDSLARAQGVYDEVSNITHRAMEGELDFYESLKARVALLQGMSLSLAQEVAHSLPLMEGARECVRALQNAGYTTLCFSGGFHLATDYFSEILNLSGSFANILHHKNGALTGEVGGEMMFSDSKGVMLSRLQKILSITPQNTIAIGDGANDLSMFAYASTRVAFCAKSVLRAAATHCIERKDLREVVSALAL